MHDVGGTDIDTVTAAVAFGHIYKSWHLFLLASGPGGKGLTVFALVNRYEILFERKSVVACGFSFYPQAKLRRFVRGLRKVSARTVGFLYTLLIRGRRLEEHVGEL